MRSLSLFVTAAVLGVQLAIAAERSSIRGSIRDALAAHQTPSQVIGSYIGAYPNGLPPPPLNTIPSEINMLMLSFAKEDQNLMNGIFSVTDWGMNLNAQAIANDKQTNPQRVYLLSLGGAADYGGSFGPRVPVDQWVNNAFTSVSGLIDQLHADGAEMQFEGGTGNPDFVAAMNGLLSKLKGAGYITAIGPYYGNPTWAERGTYSDYAKVSLDNVDVINMQMYVAGRTVVSDQVSDTEDAINTFNDPRTASKFVFGLNSVNRAPSPNVGLSAFQTLLQSKSLLGLFTWDIEDSNKNCVPSFCIEAGATQILSNPSQNYQGTCSWRN